MKPYTLLLLSLISAGYSQASFSGSINDNFTDGDTLTAQHLNNIKQAVNDNQVQNTDNAQSTTLNTEAINSLTTSVSTTENNVTANSKGITSNSKAISTLNFNALNYQQKLSGSNCDGFSYVQGFDDESNVICSTDILGTGYSRKAPVFQDNLVSLEIEGVNLQNPVFIISGVGVDIQRIEQFIEFQPHFIPGQNMEHDFVIETDEVDADTLKLMFDNPPAFPASMSVIIHQLDNLTEVFRIDLFEYAAFSYTDMSSGRTRFTFTQSLNSNNSLQFQTSPTEAFGNLVSNNPETDTLVEIEGIISNFYPQVEINEDKRTITLTYDLNEGRDLLLWTRMTTSGNGTQRSMAVIQETNGVETSRRNYFEAFPISWEIYEGFALPQKIKARIQLSFDSSEDV